MNDFWVLNFSDRGICIKDLSLIIMPNSMYNLSNKKFFNYTTEQLNKSLHYGSLHFKRDRVVISQKEPEFYDDCLVTVCEELINTNELKEYNGKKK